VYIHRKQVTGYRERGKIKQETGNKLRGKTRTINMMQEIEIKGDL
jgi:hypothetical protein